MRAKFKDEVEALEFKSKVAGGRPKAVTIEEAFQSYLVNETDKRKSARSQIGERLIFSELRRYLNKYVGISDDRLVTEISRFHLDKYQAHLVAHGSSAGERLKPATINRTFNSIKNLFRRLEEWGLLSENPACKVRKLPEQFNPRARWKDHEVQMILRSGRLSAIDKDLIRFLLATGVRLGSAVSLTEADIDVSSRTARFRHRKGSGNERIYRVPLSMAAFAIVEPRLTGCMSMHLFRDANGSPLSEGAVSKRFSRFSAATNRPHLTLHGLRHTFSTNLHAAGASTETIRLLLGHSSGRMTEKYLHTELEDLREWINK